MSLKPLTLFFGLAFLISWLIWFPLYAPAFGISGLPVLPYQHALGGLGPMAAAFLVSYTYLGQDRIWGLVRRMVQVRPVLYLMVALFAPLVLALVASLFHWMVDGVDVDLSGLWSAKEFPHFDLPGFFLYNLVFFGFGEEVGWRGFALPRMQTLMHPLTASVVLTLFWVAWHWPLFLYRPGYTSMDIAGIVGWVMSLLTGSVLLTWLYNASKGSILVCAVFHATVDIAFTAEYADAGMMGWLGGLVTVWGMGITAWILFRSRKMLQELRVREKF